MLLICDLLVVLSARVCLLSLNLSSIVIILWLYNLSFYSCFSWLNISIYWQTWFMNNQVAFNVCLAYKVWQFWYNYLFSELCMINFNELSIIKCHIKGALNSWLTPSYMSQFHQFLEDFVRNIPHFDLTHKSVFKFSIAKNESKETIREWDEHIYTKKCVLFFTVISKETHRGWKCSWREDANNWHFSLTYHVQQRSIKYFFPPVSNYSDNFSERMQRTCQLRKLSTAPYFHEKSFNFIRYFQQQKLYWL